MLLIEINLHSFQLDSCQRLSSGTLKLEITVKAMINSLPGCFAEGIPNLVDLTMG